MRSGEFDKNWPPLDLKIIMRTGLILEDLRNVMGLRFFPPGILTPLYLKEPKYKALSPHHQGSSASSLQGPVRTFLIPHS
jgi:hypothetical protein